MISATSMAEIPIQNVKSKKNNTCKELRVLLRCGSRNLKKTVFEKFVFLRFLDNVNPSGARSLYVVFFFSFTYHTRKSGLETSEIIHRVSKFFLFSKLQMSLSCHVGHYGVFPPQFSFSFNVLLFLSFYCE